MRFKAQFKPDLNFNSNQWFVFSITFS